MEDRRVAMISGAGRGIGRAVAERLAADGWALSLGLRDPGASPLGESEAVLLQPYDATRAEEPAWTAATLERFGRIDAIVANAGVMIPKSVIEAEDADLDLMFEVNVKAPRRLAKAAFEPLAASGRGRVIILASLSGKRVKSASSSLYSVTKYAAVALAHGVRQAGFDRGVRATAVCPGFVATDMARAITDYPEEAMTKPEEIASVIAGLLDLSNTASVPEITINCRLEELY